MKYILIALVVLCLLGFFGFRATKSMFSEGVAPTPTEEPVVMLPKEQQPRAKLEFTNDSHYVTVKLENVYAEKIDYSLIYDAKIKRKGQVQQVNTGVTGGGSANKDSKTYQSSLQLLGSESSGKLTFHEEIKNAQMQLTLRDAHGRQIFMSSYPFTLTQGKTIDLALSK